MLITVTMFTTNQINNKLRKSTSEGLYWPCLSRSLDNIDHMLTVECLLTNNPTYYLSYEQMALFIQN